MMVDVIKVLDHEKSRDTLSYSHRATVEMKNPVNLADPQAVSRFAFETAIRVHYHPAGYGMWHVGVKQVADGLYEVSWCSMTSCD
ncbi:hypothetical protein JQC72_06285 [Polycladomyces sp. WAk]|uniref:Uncharacterized protein n=1 Tax=Polycladomyces zharkentensis TaxID=2807616 RepID=A0ABS2WHU5_9BACL|nr:hypothetical protein [Polycladomyces sp. WAk]MBN2909130.1 hypothetical protein [Polycladomyces sp. WAk]